MPNEHSSRRPDSALAHSSGADPTTCVRAWGDGTVLGFDVGGELTFISLVDGDMPDSTDVEAFTSYLWSPGLHAWARAQRRAWAEGRPVKTWIRRWDESSAGNLGPGSVSITPVLDSFGQISSFVAIIEARRSHGADPPVSDGVTRLQQQLSMEYSHLRRAREGLIETVTHELRTPLTSVLGYSELLADALADRLTVREAAQFDAIRRNCRRLEALAQDVQDLFRLTGSTAQGSMTDPRPG